MTRVLDDSFRRGAVRIGLVQVNDGEKEQRKESHWPRDYFAQSEILSQFWGWWVVPLVGLLAMLFLPVVGYFTKQSAPTVVIYASQDQVYAEPILKEFEQQTGLRVLAVHDSEAVKTVGLMNRLLAERARPQCDV